jgi:ribosomal protein L15
LKKREGKKEGRKEGRKEGKEGGREGGRKERNMNAGKETPATPIPAAFH